MVKLYIAFVFPKETTFTSQFREITKPTNHQLKQYQTRGDTFDTGQCLHPTEYYFSKSCASFVRSYNVVRMLLSDSWEETGFAKLFRSYKFEQCWKK